jgi:hypothetical protein
VKRTELPTPEEFVRLLEWIGRDSDREKYDEIE